MGAKVIIHAGAPGSDYFKPSGWVNAHGTPLCNRWAFVPITKKQSKVRCLRCLRCLKKKRGKR